MYTGIALPLPLPLPVFLSISHVLKPEVPGFESFLLKIHTGGETHQVSHSLGPGVQQQVHEVNWVRIGAPVSPLPHYAFMMRTGTASTLLLNSSFSKSESSSEDAGNVTWGIAFIPGCGIANLYHHTCEHYSTVCPLLSGYSTKEESQTSPSFL